MATKRSSTYRKRTLEQQPHWCVDCGSTSRLEADHVQELVDNGPDDWTVLRCWRCHQKKTQTVAAERRRRKMDGNKRYIVTPHRRGGYAVEEDHGDVSDRMFVFFLLLPFRLLWWILRQPKWVGLSLIAGAVAIELVNEGRAVWVEGGAIWGVIAVFIGAWWRRRSLRRHAVRESLSLALAKQMNTIPDQLELSRIRWEGSTPVRGRVGYSAVFDDAPNSSGCQAVEDLLTRKVGRTLRFTWWPPKNVVAWEEGAPTPTAAPEAPAPVASRVKVHDRLKEGIEQAFGCKIGISIDGWHRNDPSEFTVEYPPSAGVHKDALQDAVEDKVATMLKGTWRAVWQTRDDRVTFTDTPDPLAKVVEVGAVPSIYDLAALPLGMREDGCPWTLRLVGSNGATHVLIAGATGAGKGSVIWALVHALIPALRSGHVQLWGADPKGGMELGKGRDVWDQYATSVDDIIRMLQKAVQTMQARSAWLAERRVRRHEPSPEEPLIVIVIDEIATLTKYAGDRRQRETVAQLMGMLLSQGRAPGVCLVGALQDPRKEVLGLRDLFPTRIALRCTDRIQPDLVLGDGARALGARADRIPADSPGVGYMMSDGDAAPMRVRTAWVDDARIEALSNSLRVTVT